MRKIFQRIFLFRNSELIGQYSLLQGVVARFDKGANFYRNRAQCQGVTP